MQIKHQMEEKIGRINRVLSSANRFFHISRDLASQNFVDVVRNSEFFRTSKRVSLAMCVIELAKLFQDKPKTQKQNLYSFIKGLNPNLDNLSEQEIERWKNLLHSTDEKIIEKINVWRDSVFGHLDNDFIEKISNNPLTFEEIKSLLDIALKIMEDLNNKIGGIELDFSGSQTELQCGYDHISKYQELLEIKKKYCS